MTSDVGYRKPPAEKRFQKGKSGNPGGRPGPRRMLEKRFQKALEEALLSDPEELLARTSGSPISELAEGWVCGAALADPEAIGFVLDLLPEPGRRVRFPPHLRRTLERAEAVERTEAQSQGKSTG
jgi:hypothetical protein